MAAGRPSRARIIRLHALLKREFESNPCCPAAFARNDEAGAREALRNLEIAASQYRPMPQKVLWRAIYDAVATLRYLNWICACGDGSSRLPVP
jgi:hypothetical protein